MTKSKFVTRRASTQFSHFIKRSFPHMNKVILSEFRVNSTSGMLQISGILMGCQRKSLETAVLRDTYGGVSVYFRQWQNDSDSLLTFLFRLFIEWSSISIGCWIAVFMYIDFSHYLLWFTKKKQTSNTKTFLTLLSFCYFAIG